MKTLLLEVISKLTNKLELNRNPRNDICFFYQTLTCITYLEANEIRIFLYMPLMNTKQKYEVYKVHNLPMPLHNVFGESYIYLVKYNIETTMLMVSEDRLL